MTRKKSKFLTFFCSLIPGAGEMYLGFMKQGVSIMLLTLITFSFAGVIFPPLISFSAVMWFYSFFHTHNLNSLPDDEFYAIEDDFLIHSEQIFKTEAAIRKYRRLTAFVLILFGAGILWDILTSILYEALGLFSIPDYIYSIIYRITHVIPQFAVGIGIIAIGISLIRSKKEELSGSDIIDGEYQ